MSAARRHASSRLAAIAAAWLLPGLPLGCRPPQPPPRAAAVPEARFSDITESAGLSFIQAHGGCGLHYFVEQVASGASFLDANGDGYLDVYFPQPRYLGACEPREPLHQRLYLNDGHGQFKLSPKAFGGKDTAYGLAAAAGDFDNDGDVDLYVCCYGGNTLYRNRGDGTFEDVTARAGVRVGGLSTGAAWFDYDGDGLLDLYVGRYCEWTVETDIACPGNDGKRGICHPSTYQPASHALFHNNGDGTFSDVTARSGAGGQPGRALGLAAADFDGDGRLDLFEANDLSANFLYHNRGNGTFQEVGMQENVAFGLDGRPQANMGLAVGDYDDDGDLDVLVTTFKSEPYTLYRNDGGTFTDVSGPTGIAEPTRQYLGFGTGFFDSRNNGRLDLFFANGHVAPEPHPPYQQPNQLLLNDGAGHFADAGGALPADDVRTHRGAAFGDIDNDGRVDVLVTASNDRPTLLHNDSPQARWLLLSLRDRRGCATPVGTRCTATVAGKQLTRVLLGAGSYAGSSDSRVHFGLGPAKQVDRLEIRWSSGNEQILTNVAANQVLAVREAP